ncbi:PA3715 family protein [Tenebrionicola larvae]|jgi:hypothetical protein
MAQAQNADVHTGDLALLVPGSASRRVKSRCLLPERINDDAIFISSIKIDTACWKRSPEQSAFGLRIHSIANARVRPFHENDQLRHIVNGIVPGKPSGEWDGNCTGEINDT